MNNVAHERSVAEIVGDMKEELKNFFQTRLELLKTELQERAARLKKGAPLLAVALMFLVTAYLLLTVCLVAVIAAAFAPSPYAWFLAFLIVGFAWLIIGGWLAFTGLRQMQLKNLAPRRTIELLKGDKVWLQNEARNQI